MSHSTGGQHIWCLVRACSLVCRQLSSHCILTWQRAERGNKLSQVSSYKGTNLTMRAPSLWPRYLPKVPSPNTSTFRIRILTQEFFGAGRHKHSLHNTCLRQMGESQTFKNVYLLVAVCRLSSWGTWCGVRVLVAPSACDLSSLTRDRTCILCIRRQILNHWTSREGLRIKHNPTLLNGLSVG